jgi:hypothetical protein
MGGYFNTENGNPSPQVSGIPCAAQQLSAVTCGVVEAIADAAQPGRYFEIIQLRQVEGDAIACRLLSG